MASLTRESAAGVEASAMALIRYYSAASLRPIALASKKLLILGIVYVEASLHAT